MAGRPSIISRPLGPQRIQATASIRGAGLFRALGFVRALASARLAGAGRMAASPTIVSKVKPNPWTIDFNDRFGSS